MNSALSQSIGALIARARGEYLEMPGLRLTEAQARRLWALDNATCRQVLNRLLDTQFLARTLDGHYRRADEIVEQKTLLREAPEAHVGAGGR